MGLRRWFDFAHHRRDPSATSTLTHTHLYTLPGVYTVTLTVSGLGESDTLTRTGYITVTEPIISRVITYTHDHLYRLTDADYSTGESFAYGYDALGNRTVHTRTITSTIVTTYTYPSTALRAGDDANRLDYFYEDGAQTDLTWDNNGNLLTQGTSVYTWDAANRLVSADMGGVVSNYEYDGLGQRTSQTVGGVTTEYVLDTSAGLQCKHGRRPFDCAQDRPARSHRRHQRRGEHLLRAGGGSDSCAAESLFPGCLPSARLDVLCSVA
jgi:YD repeat-containing protein